MAIVVALEGGPWSGRAQIFDDSYDRIIIGRDEELCDVVLPPDDTHVAREHCELRRKAGRYRLVLNRVHPVFIEGELAHDDYELPETATIQLGEDGPSVSMSLVMVEPDGDRAHTVRIAKPRVGKITEIHHQLSGAATMARRGQSFAVIALISLAALVVLGVSLHFDTRRRLRDALVANSEQDSDLAQARRDLEETRSALTQARTDLGQTRMQIEVTERHISERAGQMELQIAELNKHARSMTEALREVQPSVYLVAAYDDRAQLLGLATAWVFDRERGLLATNSHVARMFERKDVERMVVRGMSRSFDAPPRDHRVLRVITHPGFDLFPRLVAQISEGISDRSIAAQVAKLTGACDVALLEVEDAANLAPALRIASSETLERLGAGEAVAYVGYPSDLVGGFDYRFPTPLLQIGTVVTLTDFFLMPATAGSRAQLVQVSMPAVGGASGSPVINARGEVVATMSSVQGTRGEDGRIRTDYKGVNFAQRVDLTRELLALDANAVDALRAHWVELFGRHFVKTLDSAAIDKFAQELLEQWLSQLPFVGVRVDPVLDESMSCERVEGNIVIGVRETRLEQGQYLLIAIAGDKRNVDAAIRDGSGVLTRPVATPRFFSVKPFVVNQAGDVQMAIQRRDADSPFQVSLRCWRVQRQPSTAALRAARLDALLRRLAANQQLVPLQLPAAELTLNNSSTVGTTQVYSQRVSLVAPEPGSYIAVAISHGDEDIDLVMADTVRNTRAIDEESDSYPVAILRDLPAQTPLEVIVVTQVSSKVRCTLWLYRATPH
jgi:S1-C subfamily serine protease